MSELLNKKRVADYLAEFMWIWRLGELFLSHGPKCQQNIPYYVY